MTEMNEEGLRKVMALQITDPVPPGLVALLNRVELMSSRADTHFIPPPVLAMLVLFYEQGAQAKEDLPVDEVGAEPAFKKDDMVLIDKEDGLPTSEGVIRGRGKTAGNFRVSVDGSEKAYVEIPYEFLTLLPKAEILEPAGV